jgi:hypothetical protein
MATKSSDAALKRIAQAANEAGQRYLADQEQRSRASNILSPDEVAGDYNAGRLLSTTLGGIHRPLTSEDLITFKRNAEALGKRYKGGITAKQVIDRSRAIDRERANTEIRVAIPHQSKGSTVHFITNAGPKSDVTRHHVLVDFLDMGAAIASPSKPGELVKMVAAGALRFDCDCGRHRYWYRYIASIGRFAAGRIETGFPKIRNPELHGVACKHVLRTMQVLGTPLIKGYIEKMILKARGGFDKKVMKTAVKDARELAAMQTKQAGWKRNTIESAAEKQARFKAQRAIAATAQKANARMAKVKPEQLALQVKKFAADAARLAGLGALTPKQQAQIQRILAGKKK